MADTTKILKIVVQVVDKATAGMKSVDNATKNIDKNIGKINKRMNTFDMRLLSLMFGGMALKRAFTGVARSLITTFLRAEDTTSGLARATTRLSAGWEFLKFSIMDALNTDFFIGMIDGLINFLNWLSQLDNKWKVTFLAVTGGLILIGSGLMIIGQTKLFWDSVFGMGGFLRSTNKIHATTLGKSGVFTALKKFALVGIVIKAIFDLDKFLTGEGGMEDLISSMGTNFILAGLIFSKGRWLLPIGIVLKLVPFGEQIREFGQGLVEKGEKKLSESGFLNREKRREVPMLGFLTGTLIGGFTTGSGAIISGLGDVLDKIDNYVTKVDSSKISTENLSTAMNEELVPTTENVIEKIDEKKQTLPSSLQKNGTERKTISGEKTDEFIVASDSRITQMDSEISKYDELIERQKQAFASFKRDLGLTETSSVSDD